MTLIRKWALAVCSAFLLTNYSAITNSQVLDPSQVYNTVNLVNNSVDPTGTTSTWQNVGLWNQGLPCWAPGGPVYCGPLPYFNNGSFNFSYGYTDVYQTVGIAAALPNSGTGLRVNGYNFGFMAKNGNGWDGGGLDTLSAYVNFYDPKGNVAYSKNYNLNYVFDWTQFNYSETFATPYASKDLSTARYGFVGMDNNFWAGPYGPEVYNISFSLKYSVDPCYVDVLSSPNCPGYLDKISSLSATPVVSAPTTTTTTATTTPSTVSTDVAAPPVTTTSVTTTAASITVASTTAATPTATNPQPRVGEVVTSGSPAKVPMSTILSLVRAEQNRVGAVEAAAVQDAVSQAQQTTQAAETAAVQMTAAANKTNSMYSLSTGPVVVAAIANSNSATSAIASVKPADTQRGLEDQNRSNGLNFGGINPVLNITGTAPSIPTETTQGSNNSVVNRAVKDNDAAGGVSIAAMSRQPVGFDAYTTAMPDTAFYAPKEIYRNQRVVDNARAQRLLSGASDQLHQRMVDQQYQGR